MRFSKINKFNDYIVMFCAPDKNITRFFLDKKFGHIKIYKFEGNKTFLIESTYGSLKVKSITSKTEITKIGKLNLKVKIEDLASKNNFLNWIIMHLPHRMDCVSQSKYILGVHGWCLTPKSFYKKLLKKKFWNVIEAEEIK